MMTELINQHKLHRFTLLNELYEATKGNTNQWHDLRTLGSKKGVTLTNFTTAYHYLTAEKLIKGHGAGYTAYITHAGVKAIEAVYDAPDTATLYFQSLNDMGL